MYGDSFTTSQAFRLQVQQFGCVETHLGLCRHLVPSIVHTTDGFVSLQHVAVRQHCCKKKNLYLFSQRKYEQGGDGGRESLH